MRTTTLILAAILALAVLSSARAQETVVVPVGDFFFCGDSVPPDQCVTTIDAGDTVTWSYQEGTAGHTVTACGQSCDSPTDSPAFDSGRVLAPGTFSVTFDSPGTYLYYCEFHPQAMSGTVSVVAAPTAAPTQAPTLAPTPTPEPQPIETPSPTESPTPTAITAPSSTRASTLTLSPSPASEDDNGDDGGSGALLWVIVGGVGLIVLLSGGAAIAYVMRRGPSTG